MDEGTCGESTCKSHKKRAGRRRALSRRGRALSMRARPARARRQMAAGDQLRVVYDQLSRDPNSLANLDQDLPNYAQHQVPIFSLPQARRHIP